MSEKIDLLKIKSPELGSATYGGDVNKTFENIDNNFQKLSNRDFIRGNDGDSVSVDELDLVDYPELVENIKLAIQSNVNGIGLGDIIYDGKTIHWYDNLYNNPGKILMLYKLIHEVDGTLSHEYISSMPYIYIDPRFADDLSDMQKENDYSDVVDVSCVLYFDKNQPNNFKLVNLFPTLYYDKDSFNFCWRVWGNKTGLIANGPAGKSGLNGSVYIVVREYGDSGISNVFRVKEIMVNGTFKKVSDITDIDNYIGFPAIVHYDSGNKNDPDKNKFWMSNIVKDGDDLTVICSDYNVMENKFNSTELFNTLLDINPYSTSSGGNFAKGIFLPMGASPSQTNQSQRAHMLYNEHVNKTDYNNKNNRTKLILSTVDNVGAANSANKYPGAAGVVWPNEVDDAEFEIRMETKMTKPVEIKPSIKGVSQHALSVNNDNIKIQMNGSWYTLYVDGDGFLKCKPYVELSEDVSE